MAPSDIKCIAVLDMENYAKCNKHSRAVSSELLDTEGARGLLSQFINKTIDKRAFDESIRSLVDRNRPLVESYEKAVRSDLANPRTLVQAVMPDLSEKDDVRLVVVTDHRHQEKAFITERTENIRGKLRAAVSDRLVTQEELDAFEKGVNAQDLSDIAAPATLTSSEAPPESQVSAPAAVDDSPADDQLASVKRDAERCIHWRLAKTCRDVVYDSVYVMSVAGATADELIAAVAARLKPNLVCVVSADSDFSQIRRYGVWHVNSCVGVGEGHFYKDLFPGDVFLLKCALRGKNAQGSLLKWGPAFGTIPAGFPYLDVIGAETTGVHDCTPDYRARFEAFNQMTWNEQPWNRDSLAGVLEWLLDNKERAPEDVRVRFLRNLCRQNIDPGHEWSITPAGVKAGIDRVVGKMIQKRGWSHLVRFQREQQGRKQDAEHRKAQRPVWVAEKAAWKARQAENFVEPYTDEIIKCVRLVAMLQKHAPPQAAAAPVTKSEFKFPEGVSILKKDRDAGLDSWFGGLGGGSKKGKGKGGRDRSGGKLSLCLDALASLQSISVAAPLTVGEVAGTIEKVKERKVQYEGLQKEAEAKREAMAIGEKGGVS